MIKQKAEGSVNEEESKAEEPQEKSTLKSFYFPSLDRSIQAESIEEATKIAEAELGSK